uniref:uncharacterized protein LOC120336665 n=1 Tax=Styela clava TaxID=7725 RepID=UPI00193A120E|nr:uncharacterized protein LOC120336665 [Styela clava]
MEPYYTCFCRPEYNGTTCEEPTYKWNGNCKYHVDFYNKKTFSDASTTCNSLGGTVVMMKTNAIQDFIESQIINQYGDVGDTISFWIGAYKTNNDWVWVDGTTITSGRWSWNPVIPGNEYLTYFTSTRNNMTWINNHGKRNQGYICEVPTVDMCSPSPCLNWGTCSSIGCQRSCKCLDGFTGNFCETNRDVAFAPTVVKSNNGADVGIKIPFPEEHNGPISCLFLILVYKHDDTSNQLITTLDDLVKLAIINVKKNEAYIALAMARSDISDVQNHAISKKLGDGTASSCIVNDDMNSIQTKNKTITKIEIKGNNLKLADGAEYSYFTISVFQRDDNAVLLKFSNVSYFITETATIEQSTNATIAITVTCIGILVAVVLIILWIIKKKRSTEKPKSASEQRSKASSIISPYQITFISNNAASSGSQQIQPESSYSYNFYETTCYEEPMPVSKKDVNTKKTYENINFYENCGVNSDPGESIYEDV